MVLTNDQLKQKAVTVADYFRFNNGSCTKEEKSLILNYVVKSIVCSDLFPESCQSTSTSTGTMDPTKCNCPCMDNPICQNCYSWHQANPGAVHA